MFLFLIKRLIVLINCDKLDFWTFDLSVLNQKIYNFLKIKDTQNHELYLTSNGCTIGGIK